MPAAGMRCNSRLGMACQYDLNAPLSYNTDTTHRQLGQQETYLAVYGCAYQYTDVRLNACWCRRLQLHIPGALRCQFAPCAPLEGLLPLGLDREAGEADTRSTRLAVGTRAYLYRCDDTGVCVCVVCLRSHPLKHVLNAYFRTRAARTALSAADGLATATLRDIKNMTSQV